jgi:hypothetical protein
MSSNRPSKKAGLAPGQVVGRSPTSLLTTSPQRKIGSKKGKRSAPQPKPLNSSAAAFVPNASFHLGTNVSGARSKPSKSFAAAAHSNVAPAGSAKKAGVRVDESKNTVVEVGLAEEEDDDEYWEDMVPSDEETDEHIGEVDAAAAPSPSKSSDGSAPDGDAAATSTAGSTGKGSGSLASFDSSSDDESTDEPPVYYADLAQFDGSIRYQYNKGKDFWFADYSNLSVKERRELLKSREQSSSGTKAALGRRLEAGDARRLEILRTCGREDKLEQHERNIKALLASRSKGDTDRRRSQSSEPVGKSLYPGRSLSQPAFSRDASADPSMKKKATEPAPTSNEHGPIDVDVEDASEDDADMDGYATHSDAGDLFGGSPCLCERNPLERMEPDEPSDAHLKTPQASPLTGDKPPAKTPAVNKNQSAKPASTPPETIATASTA